MLIKYKKKIKMKVQMPASNTMPNFFAVETLQNRRKVSLEPVLKVSIFMSYVRNEIFLWET